MNSSRVGLPQSVPDHKTSDRDHPTPRKAASKRWLWFVLVFALSTLYMAHELKRGWIPSDDGVLAESAERVLQGELPHRDYHELYTGLLSYLNAGAFKVLGANLASMRYVLFLFCLVWVFASFYVASRFVSAPVAGAVTLLALVWGPPNGPIPMPSWYNLFFATFGLAALMRYIEEQKKRWLILAGICGGISSLFKMTGLYFVAGALLFLAFREQLIRSAEPIRLSGKLLYRAFLVLSIFSYEALLLDLLSKHANAATYIYFWLPNLAIGFAVIWYEFHENANRGGRFAFLFSELAPFGAGVVLPIALFLTPYCLTSSLSRFFADLFVQPVQLVLSNSVKPPVQWLVEGIVLTLLLVGVMLLTRSKTAPRLSEEFLLGAPLLLLIPSILLLTRQSVGFYQLAWSTIWVFTLFVAIYGFFLLVRRPKINRLSCVQRQRLFVTLSVTVCCGLIQFPFSIPCIYFCYAAPLVVLAATAVVSMMGRTSRVAVSGMMCFCFLYAVLEFTPGYIFHMGREYAPDIQTVRLSLPRAGGLRVSATNASEYEGLESLIRQHARGDSILAAPNCPQVYFLSGLRSPNRDFLGFANDFEQGAEGVLKTLKAHQINLVVLNHLDSMFVQPVPNGLRRALEREFPSHAETENFEVRWKE